jgi:hypothetical protein
MMIDILSVVTNEVHSSNSVFGYVNDLLIERALAMLMQTNADLFKLARVQVRENVVFTDPGVVKRFYKSDWKFKVLENSAMIGFTPILKP